MTSDGQEPTRNSCLMSGTAAEELFDLAVEFLMGVGHAGKIALLEDRGAEAGSAKIITPAADCRRCAQVRDPTTRKKASCILRCSQMMPVSPQKTSRWPRSFRTGASLAGAPMLMFAGRFMPRPPLRGGPCPQFPQELGGVDHVGRVGRERDPHLLIVGPASQQRPDIGQVQAR
jgi:hypothetical protein